MEHAAEQHHNEVFYLDPKFWVAIATLLFVIVVYKKVSAVIINGLDGRANRIRAQLEEASKLREEAQNILASIQRKDAKASEEAEKIIAHAKEEAQSIISDAKDKLERDIEKRKELALQKIKLMEDAAVKEIKQKTVQLTLEASKNMIENKLDAKLSANLVGFSVEKLSKTIH
jgi:F-type H+-transporting ATPase subunit b